jgi:hypothetical protein
MLDQGVFQNIGAVTWDTTAKTSGFTAVSGNGYFVNTTSAAITVTLPSSPSAGDIVGIKDYANTADTNNITIGRNGSNIQGTASDFIIDTEGRSVVLVYVDGTQGWKITSSSQASDIVSPQFVTATGGTITCCGDFKIHTFTGPGTFCVSNAGNAEGSNTFAYVVVGGGAGGNSGNVSNGGGGGGGGGLVCVTSTPASTGGFPIAVGGGGAGGANPVSPTTNPLGYGAAGSNSTGFSSTGGGAPIHQFHAPGPSERAKGAGPSGTPQSNAAGTFSDRGGAGGGGAGGVGGNSPGNPQGGAGGNGLSTPLDCTTRAGGGGGSGWNVGSGGSGAGGPGGGGAGGTGPQNPGCNATANTGGGGGGGAGKCGVSGTVSAGGNGGSGVVIVKYRFQ